VALVRPWPVQAGEGSIGRSRQQGKGVGRSRHRDLWYWICL